LESEEIIHQDVKPANMLINKNTVIKLCDFGISHTFSELKSNPEYIGGTANYTPPQRDLSVQDDMWSLGISLYEVVDGKNPFAFDDSYGKFITIMQWQPSILKEISPDMQQLILHL
jgi:mitogen-activated protein kinase kinase